MGPIDPGLESGVASDRLLDRAHPPDGQGPEGPIRLVLHLKTEEPLYHRAGGPGADDRGPEPDQRSGGRRHFGDDHRHRLHRHHSGRLRHDGGDRPRGGQQHHDHGRQPGGHRHRERHRDHPGGTSATSTADQFTYVVLSPGVYAVGTTLYVVGANPSDYALISSYGSKLDGSTGLAVVATLNNAITAKTFSQTFTAIDIFGYGGNDILFLLIPTLTLPTKVVEGNGNNYLQLAGGNDSVTFGSGSNQVFGGNGNKTITDADAAGTPTTSRSARGTTPSASAPAMTPSPSETVTTVPGPSSSGGDPAGGNGNDNVQLGRWIDLVVEGERDS